MVKSPSAVILVLANMVPILGVMFCNWQVLDILILYWTESVVIGVLNVFRMIRCQTSDLISGLIPAVSNREIPAEAMAELNKRMPAISGQALKAVLIPFFILHYGGFCTGHLLGVMSFFGDRAGGSDSLTRFQYFWQTEYWIAVGAIAASHLYSYFSNYVGKNEYRNTNLIALMTRPYGRIVAMHMTIIIGAGFVIWQGSALPLLFVLIVAKTWLDLSFHEKERVKLSAPHADKGVPAALQG